MNDPASIRAYHAHVYYRDEDERARAAELREAVDVNFEVALGRWRDEPVGPHPLPMYQVSFAARSFAEIIPWLMLNRRGLTILIHPVSGDDVADHRDHPFWMGETLDLDIGFLEAGNTSA
jgi:aromatic ring-cleaving dioxygenase